MSWSRDFVHEGEPRRVTCRHVDGDSFAVSVGDAQHDVQAHRLPDGRVVFTFEGRSYVAAAARSGDGVQVRVDGHTWQLAEHKGGRAGGGEEATGDVKAPMTGTVLAVSVEVGQAVSIGDTVAVVTAMKMEHKLIAEIDGEVVEVLASEGDNVDEGALLVRIE